MFVGGIESEKDALNVPESVAAEMRKQTEHLLHIKYILIAILLTLLFKNNNA